MTPKHPLNYATRDGLKLRPEWLDEYEALILKAQGDCDIEHRMALDRKSAF
jgi:hypothetical protein